MNMFKQKKQSNSLVWAAVAIIAGFCMMLLLSLFAYKMENRYVTAMESKVAAQQSRINELEKLLQSERAR